MILNDKQSQHSNRKERERKRGGVIAGEREFLHYRITGRQSGPKHVTIKILKPIHTTCMKDY